MSDQALINECQDLITKHFHGDKKKTIKWFTTCNPALGGFKPLDMIKVGRVNKLHTFIKNAINENYI